MSEPNQVGEPSPIEVTRRVVEQKSDPVTRWLVWGAVFLTLMLVAVVVYGVLTGAFSGSAPDTAEEAALAQTAEAIRANPTNGAAYAIRAETLNKLGKVDEAYEVLDQGEKAVGDAVPALIYILRSRTMLLNQEKRFAEAEAVGKRALEASDRYIAQQIRELTSKNLVPAVGSLDARGTIDAALQLAIAQSAQEKWEDAAKAYEYALFYEPTAADILVMRGWVYVEMGAETSATADFNEALKYLPNDESALAGLKALESK